MRKLLLLVGFFGLLSINLFGQTAGDYQSRQNGNWNTVTTWQVFNAGSFNNLESAGAGAFQNVIPSSASGIITIADNTTVTIPNGQSITADQIQYQTSGNPGTLSVASGGTLTVNDGSGDDIRLFNDFVTPASLSVAGTLSLNNAATIVDDDYAGGVSPVSTDTYHVLNGGFHLHTTGTSVAPIPFADWQSGSTCQINATSGTVPTINSGIVFHHFTWNGTSEAAAQNLLAGLRNINGDFTINNTGGFIFDVGTTTPHTLNIGRDFLIQGDARVVLSTTANPVTFNIGRDFSISSTNASANTILFISTGTLTLNITGNFNKSGASIATMVSSPTGTASMNLQGNFSLTGGTFTRNSSITSGSATVPFTGASTRTFTNSSATLSNGVNFVVANGKTLNFGTSQFTGTGNFTLQAGATMGVGSPDGLTILSTGLGNVTTSGTRSYAASSNLVYNGSGQSLGDEWGASGAINGVAVNLEIANTGNGVVVNNAASTTNVVGNLTLTSGSLGIGNTNTVDIKSNFIGNGGSIKGDATSSLTFSGAGTITGNLNFAAGFENLKNFTLARSASVVLGTTLTIGSAVTDALAFTSTGNLNFTGQTLTVNGDITQSGSGGLTTTSATNSNLLIGGTGALSTLPFTGSILLNNVTFGRTSGGTYTWNTAGSVAGTLDLNSGTLTHSSGLTMLAGSLFKRSAGTSFTTNAPNTTGAYDVTYTGNLTSGLELPSNSTDLRNLSVAGNVTLGGSITINGNLSITSGTLNAASFNVTMAGATFAVNGGSFSINSGSLVTFSRSGTTTLSGSTIAGTQFGNITINSGATVSAPNANLNVSGTWTNNGTFTANSGKITFNGAAQSINPNGQAFNDVEFAGTLTKTLAGQLDANGTLTITSTLNVGANFPINVAGSWVNNGTFVAGGGTVTFNGTNQTINPNGQAFFNLTIANSGTKTLSNPVSIGGVLTINSGTTFDVGVGSNAVTLSGNWVNNGSFTRQSGTVTFNGTTTLSGSTAPSLNNVTITGALTAFAGTTDVSGDWLQSSGTFNANGGTLQFSGNTQSITPGGQTFNNVTITGTNTKTLQGSTIIAGVLTLSAGTFSTNGNALTLDGNFVSNSTSTLTAGTVTFAGTTTISGGTAPTFGAITITGTLTPSSNFNINGNLVNNGTLNAGSATVTFGGNTTVSGSSTSSFNNVVISSTLTAPGGNLNVAGNWANNGTFNASAGTIVFNGTTTISGSSTTNFANITISGTVNAPTATNLNVAGNFANSGTFNASTGTVVFNGSSTQSISGSSVTDFNNITVTNAINSPAVQVQSSQNLHGVLTLSGANTVFDADGSTNNRIFKLMSTGDSPTVDASIATLPSGTAVSGNVTMQRYMAIEGASGGRIYRYISSPVQNAAVSQLQVFIPVTGTFTGASACSGCGTAQSMFSYDETVTTDTNLSGTADFNDGYINFPAAINTETFVAGKGYTIFVRGNIAPVSTAGTALWELFGPINAGNITPITLPVSFTSSGTVANDGWNLVGNPYPSTIDWQAASGWTKTNINDATYMLDNGLGSPAYATFIGGVGANGGTRYIAAGQAFFVKSDGGSPALSASEAVKVGGQQTTFFRLATVPDLMRITLRQGTIADESVIRFTSSATANFDSQLDAHKLSNPGTMFNLSSITPDNSKLVINSLPAGGCNSVVKLDVSNVTPGSYSLDFSDFDSFTDGNTKLYINDSFLGTSSNIRVSPSYVFQVTPDPLSYGSNRFTLAFGEPVPTITALGSTRCNSGTVTLTAKGSKKGNYRWFDAAGNAITGATDSTFTTPSLIKTTTYYVAGSNSTGCLEVKLPVVATVTTIDPVVISVNGKAFQSSYASGNQWYLNGQAIPGATSQTFEPILAGVYKVEVTSSNCTTSAEREFSVTGLEPSLPSHISIYPNPTSGVLTVAVQSDNEVNARIMTLLGVTISDQPLVGTSVKKGTFNLQEQSEGMYILIVQDGDQAYKTRIIKKR